MEHSNGRICFTTKVHSMANIQPFLTAYTGKDLKAVNTGSNTNLRWAASDIVIWKKDL